MNPLNNEQKELIFDYCIGLTNEEQSAEADHLIFSNAEAQEVHARLQAALDPLQKAEFEKCPDDLAENTVLRLNERHGQVKSDSKSSLQVSRQKLSKSEVRSIISARCLQRQLCYCLQPVCSFQLLI